jgi:hypothetical protein
MKAFLVTVLAGAFVLSAGLAAAQQKTQRIRGTISAFDGKVLAIKSRDGADLEIELREKASVAAARAITLADLKKGDYVGSTTVQDSYGVLVAHEVHRLPRTVKEGHRPWDLLPNSMMTNANVATVARAADGNELTLEYSGGSQKILVPPGTPIVETAPADRSFLKPGEYVFLSANVGEDGKLSTAARIQVSHGGVKPPQ